MTRCGNIEFSPSAADRFIDVRVRRISCRAARSVLRRWRENDYAPPGPPRGWKCKLGTGTTTYNGSPAVCRKGARVIRYR
jgi:hypothetical protein